jgi:hypothetical protein
MNIDLHVILAGDVSTPVGKPYPDENCHPHEVEVFWAIDQTVKQHYLQTSTIQYVSLIGSLGIRKYKLPQASQLRVTSFFLCSNTTLAVVSHTE